MEAQLYDDAIWAQAASELGLSLVDGASGVVAPRLATLRHRMRGEIEGHAVTATHGMLNTSTVTVTASLRVPLLLGLKLTRHSMGFVTMRSLDPVRARALTAKLGDLGRAIDVMGYDTILELSDSAAKCARMGLADGPGFYVDAIRKTVAVAHYADHARRRLEKPPWEAEMMRTWSLYAEKEGVHFDGDQMRVWGADGRHRLVVQLFAEDRFRVRATLEFASPLGLSLSVVRAGAALRAMPFMQRDVHTGDDPFDRCFVVHGEPAETVRDRLTPTARGLIGELDRSGELRVTDDAVHFDTEDLTLDVGRLVGDLSAVARDIELEPKKSPYR